MYFFDSLSSRWVSWGKFNACVCFPSTSCFLVAHCRYKEQLSRYSAMSSMQLSVCPWTPPPPPIEQLFLVRSGNFKQLLFWKKKIQTNFSPKISFHLQLMFFTFFWHFWMFHAILSAQNFVFTCKFFFTELWVKQGATQYSATKHSSFPLTLRSTGKSEKLTSTSVLSDGWTQFTCLGFYDKTFPKKDKTNVTKSVEDMASALI